MKIHITKQFDDTVIKMIHGTRLSKADKKALKRALSSFQEKKNLKELDLDTLERLKNNFHRMENNMYKFELDLVPSQIENFEKGLKKADSKVKERLEKLMPTEEEGKDPVLNLKDSLNEGLHLFHRMEKGKWIQQNEANEYWNKLDKAYSRAEERIHFELSVPFLKEIQSPGELRERFKNYLEQL